MASLIKKADELEDVMGDIAILKAKLKPLEEKEEKMREDICAKLIKDGLQYIKTTSGLGFGIVKGRVAVKVKKGKDDEALQWAMKEYPGILRIGAADLTKVALPKLELPDFLERVEGEPHLAVRTQEE